MARTAYKRDTVELHLPCGGVLPLGRVADVKGDVLQRYWEVDEVEINIVQAKVRKGALQSRAHVLSVVVCEKRGAYALHEAMAGSTMNCATTLSIVVSHVFHSFEAAEHEQGAVSH